MKLTLTLAATVLPLAVVAGPIVSRTNVNGCKPLGCYTDSVSFRALDINTQVPGGPSGQSPEACTAACIAHDLAFAGVEFGGECWCGAFINNGQTLASNQALCSMPCNGAPGEICGGADGINIYDCTAALPAPVSYNGCAPLGCYTDSVSLRTLATNTQVVGGPNNQGPDVCTAACKAAGFRYAGNEYGGECWCGNSLDNGGGPAPDLNEQCQMPCHGDSSLFCGGPDRLTLFDCSPPAPPTSCSNPGTCNQFVIITDASCGPFQQCVCAFDADGSAVCVENTFCSNTPCTSDSDCAAGGVCWTQSCCGHGICTVPSTICANPARVMFRGVQNSERSECTGAYCD